jgi:serine/threonine protein kinase
MVLIGEIISRYELVEHLGREGSHAIYRARDLTLGRDVAIKVLPAGDPDALERFRREARTASSLTHPHICAVHDFGEENGRAFLVCELLEGDSLDELLRKGPLPAERVVHLGLQIADALVAAHRHGLTHGALVPSQVFITTAGHVKLLGFGQVSAPPTEGRAGLGAPDPIDDVHSLGAVLYEATTGVAPGSPPQPIRELAPSCPPSLDGIIDKALEADRTLRYQHAADVLVDLRRLRRKLD